jgi:D-alanyl-D-alanine carboxypeptidase
MKQKINLCKEDDLVKLGIAADWAKFIIDTRKYKGVFTSSDDILSLELPLDYFDIIDTNFSYEIATPSKQNLVGITEYELVDLGITEDWARYILGIRDNKGGKLSKEDVIEIKLSKQYEEIILANYLFELPDVLDVLPSVEDANWPPKPTTIKQYTWAEICDSSNFGDFEFEANPSENSGRGIKILGSWVQNNIISVNVPQLVGINRGNFTDRIEPITTKNCTIQFHKNGKQQLIKLWEDWEKSGVINRVLTFSAGFVPRYSSSNKTILSRHAWGIAFDLNVEWNGQGVIPPLINDKGCVRELIEIANNNGFYWGGHFEGKSKSSGKLLVDGMHFELGKII